MKLTPAERETIILYDEAGDTANVYTYDHKLIEKLKQLHKKHPDQIYPEHPVRHGAVSYTVPKRCVAVQSSNCYSAFFLQPVPCLYLLEF